MSPNLPAICSSVSWSACKNSNELVHILITWWHSHHSCTTINIRTGCIHYLNDRWSSHITVFDCWQTITLTSRLLKGAGHDWTESIYPINKLSSSLQGSHKNLKTEFHDFSMTDLLFSITPILTVSGLVMIVSHDNHKLEAAIAMRTSNSMTFPWHPATFHDCLGNFHIPKLFHGFPRQPFFPGFSMTVGTLPLASAGHPGKIPGA